MSSKRKANMVLISSQKAVNLILAVVLALILLSTSNLPAAENYPTRPITIMAPLPPGGGNDLTARLLAELGKEAMGQPIVVVNKPGGSSTIPLSIVAKEKPDGYNIAIFSQVGIVQQSQMRQLGFDIFNDFEYVMGFYSLVDCILIRSDKPWKSLKDLIAYSKQNPGKVTYGCPSTGGTPHINVEIVANKEQVRWRMIPYDGSVQTAAAVLGGHVDFGIASISVCRPHIRSGDCRALALGKAALGAFKDVPALEDLGYGVKFELFAMAVPRNTPPATVKKIHDVFKQGMENPQYEDLCKKLDGFNTYVSGEDVLKGMKEQYPIRGKTLKDLGLIEKK